MHLFEPYCLSYTLPRPLAFHSFSSLVSHASDEKLWKAWDKAIIIYSTIILYRAVEHSPLCSYVYGREGDLLLCVREGGRSTLMCTGGREIYSYVYGREGDLLLCVREGGRSTLMCTGGREIYSYVYGREGDLLLCVAFIHCRSNNVTERDVYPSNYVHHVATEPATLSIIADVSSKVPYSTILLRHSIFADFEDYPCSVNNKLKSFSL